MQLKMCIRCKHAIDCLTLGSHQAAYSNPITHLQPLLVRSMCCCRCSLLLCRHRRLAVQLRLKLPVPHICLVLLLPQCSVTLRPGCLHFCQQRAPLLGQLALCCGACGMLAGQRCSAARNA